MPRIVEEKPYNGVLDGMQRLGLVSTMNELRDILRGFQLHVEERGTRVCVGVEVQFSARSDLIVVDVIHLRKAVTEGKIDVAVLACSKRPPGCLLDRSWPEDG